MSEENQMPQMPVPLPPDQVAPTFQNALAFLDREETVVPGNMVEGIMSLKSMCRALLSGQLILCQAPQSPVVAGGPDPDNPPGKKPAARKKTPRKKA